MGIGMVTVNIFLLMEISIKECFKMVIGAVKENSYI
jgi:hypothetical protein